MQGWQKLQLLMLACFVTAPESHLKQPKCKSAANCEESFSLKNRFFYYVKGSGGNNAKKQVKMEYHNDDWFEICCNCRPRDARLAVDDPALPALPRPTIIKKLELTGCLVPNGSYYDALKVLNINFSCEDCVLILSELPAKPRLQGYHLKGLFIKELIITAETDKLPTCPKKDFLFALPKLKRLTLQQGVHPEEEVRTLLPTSLESLVLHNTHLFLTGNLTTQRNECNWLKRLPSLKFLSLEEKDMKREKGLMLLPPLSSLPKLTNLILVQLSLTPMPNNTSWLKGSNLQNFVIERCELDSLPENFFEGAYITKMKLFNNTLSSLPDDVFAPLNSSLIELDLSHNNLTGFDLVRAVQSLKQLKTLKANNNPLGSLCGSGQYYGREESGLPKTLHHLELKNTNTTRICHDWIENDFLTDINLDKNNIEFLRYRYLKMRRAKNEPVTLSLKRNINKNNQMKILISKSDYDECRQESLSQRGGRSQRVQVHLTLDSFACDCNAYWFREMLLQCGLLVPTPNVKCTITSKATALLAHDPEDLTCPYNGPCPTACSCKKRQPDNATVVRCTGELPRSPRWPPSARGFPLALHVAPRTLAAIPRLSLIELHAPNNNITNIDIEDIPDTLHVLDVQNNSIEHITSKAAQKLLRLSTNDDYNVLLAGNPLACACEDETAIETLRRAKIMDWNMTQCADSRYVVEKRNFCVANAKMLPMIVLGMTSVFCMLISGAILLIYKWPRIKQFLFDHGMCLEFVLNVQDNIDDPMKTHDVFISYAYKDLNCAKILMEKIDRRGHSIIEHCRHWLPGKTIMEQIVNSVMSARRTLLLVSDNYANSTWGMEEFHSAHAHALERGSARLIVVLCALQSTQKLPEDLQLYLKNNTYLDWSDPYFWLKLWRVMPQPRVSPTSAIAPSLRGQHLINAPPFSLAWQYLDTDLPLSELVLLAPVQLSEPDGLRQSSAQISAVIPEVKEVLERGENKATLWYNTQRELPIPKDNLPYVRGQQMLANAALSLSLLSLDKNVPLSELVLVAPVQRYHNDPRESPGHVSPVTPVVKEPSYLGVTASTLTSNIQRESTSSVVHPAVSPCGC